MGFPSPVRKDRWGTRYPVLRLGIGSWLVLSGTVSPSYSLKYPSMAINFLSFRNTSQLIQLDSRTNILFSATILEVDLAKNRNHLSQHVRPCHQRMYKTLPL